MGFFKDMFSLGKELFDVLGEGRKEFKELMTDGFKEMVIKGNNDYKTSFEKRDEANRIISSARSRYNRTFQEVEAALHLVQQQIKHHYQFKLEKYKQLHSTYAADIEKYVQQYELKKKEYEQSYLSFDQHNLSFPIFSSSIAGFVSHKRIDQMLFELAEQRKRVKEADYMLEEARRIRAELDLECEKLKRLQSNLSLVEKTINEERSLIERLLHPMVEKMQHTKGMLSSTVNTREQLEEIERAIQIIKLLEKTLITQFLGDNSKITQQYKDVINQLREMEKQMNERRK